MLKLEIHDLENDRVATRFGSDRDLLDFIRLHYPLAKAAITLNDAVNVLNASDLYAVRTGQFEADVDKNLLPLDYLTHSQAEADDPWPRAGDRD